MELFTKQEIRQYGIYFTPDFIVKNIIDKLHDIKSYKRILEPSCGNGSFLSQLPKNCEIVGVELITELCNICKLKFPYVKIINEDYLKWLDETKFDLIIGNPPFHLINKKQLDKRFTKYMTSRPDIFICFIIDSLHRLSENGVLAFVIPETFLNCQFYENTRKYILEHFEIMDIYKNKGFFKSTTCSTITILIRNSHKCENNFKWSYNNVLVYDVSIIKMLNQSSLKRTIKLKDYGNHINIYVGKIIWNRYKEYLSDVYVEGKPVLIFDTLEKRKKWILKDINKPILFKDVIAINRGHGNSKYRFSISKILSKNYPNGFILENHLICIEADDNLILNEIFEGFTNDDTQKFIKVYTTNGALSINDLMKNIIVFFS